MTNNQPVYSAALIDGLYQIDVDSAKRDAQLHRHQATVDGWIAPGLCVGAAVCGAFPPPFMWIVPAAVGMFAGGMAATHSIDSGSSEARASLLRETFDDLKQLRWTDRVRAETGQGRAVT